MIATGRKLTRRSTRISLAITILVSIVTFLDAVPHEPVATLGILARAVRAVGAVIGHVVVAIIAFFDPGLHKAVATLGILTRAIRAVGAGVVDIIIAIIALLAYIGDPVAAGCRDAVISACVSNSIAIVGAVVALLFVLWIDDVVTAEWTTAIGST
jgi:hypothetical protein